MKHTADEERLKKWRLILGATAARESGAEGSGPEGEEEETQQGRGSAPSFELSPEEKGMDDVLEALYDPGRQGGLGPSSPNVSRWLGDIRAYFPSPVVRILQQDALQKLGLEQMLLEPELLDSLEPDVNLVATLISLQKALPEKTRATARMIVKRVADDIERQLRRPLEQSVRGSLRHPGRNLRPSLKEMDWPRTILANLRHYQPRYKTVIPEKRIGFGHKRAMLRDIILLVDLSGSMAHSLVFAGIIGSILASIRSLRTRLIVFDTEVVDLSDQLGDPVDLLFGLNLGGGTDIGKALTYARGIVERPEDTTVFLLSDLYEGYSAEAVLKHAGAIVHSGCRLLALLALDDKGTPSYDETMAEKLGLLGIPAFSSTPQHFASLLGNVLNRGDLGAWMNREGIQQRNAPA